MPTCCFDKYFIRLFGADAMGVFGGADGWSPRDAHPGSACDRHPRTQHASTTRGYEPIPATPTTSTKPRPERGNLLIVSQNHTPNRHLVLSLR